MSKTPVSILQEIMVKKGGLPNYELIHDGGGTHINTFTYKVTCDDLITIGTGRCKKDAKHEAASAMLQAIATQRNYPQLPESPIKSPVRTPIHEPKVPPRVPANVPFINTIGALQVIYGSYCVCYVIISLLELYMIIYNSVILRIILSFQDLCAENNLGEPEYILISDVGPPHAKVFTIRCAVCNFTEVGTGTTKKQAKHEAAKKMIDKISDLMTEFNGSRVEENYPNINSTEIVLANKAASIKYTALSKTLITKKSNLGIKLSKYHTILKDSIDIDIRHKVVEELHDIISQKLNEIITDEVIIKKISKFEEVLSEIDVTLSIKDVEIDITDPQIPFLRVLQLDTYPVITQIGIGKTEKEAICQALVQTIKTLITLLS